MQDSKAETDQDSTEADDVERRVDEAFRQLTELFSKPIKNAQKPSRRYDLVFENGEPVFVLSELDVIFDEILNSDLGLHGNSPESQRIYPKPLVSRGSFK